MKLRFTKSTPSGLYAFYILNETKMLISKMIVFQGLTAVREFTS
jgi:hypothetical protein